VLRNHRGEFEGDLEGVEAFVPQGRLRAGRGGAWRSRQARREWRARRLRLSGSLRFADRSSAKSLRSFVGREIQCGTPFKGNGPSAVLTPKDGACLHAWSPAVSRPKRSNRRERYSRAAGSRAGGPSVLVPRGEASRWPGAKLALPQGEAPRYSGVADRGPSPFRTCTSTSRSTRTGLAAALSGCDNVAP